MKDNYIEPSTLLQLTPTRPQPQSRLLAGSIDRAAAGSMRAPGEGRGSQGAACAVTFGSQPILLGNM
jgi:hypothetical protein